MEYTRGDIELLDRHLARRASPFSGCHQTSDFYLECEFMLGSLPRWPTKLASAQQMKMHVKNSLARVSS
jgi:hypothetical protein